MKQFDSINSDRLNANSNEQDFANFFNVYSDPVLGKDFITYSINKSVTIDIDESSDAILLYQVKQGDHWTILSWKYYGTHRLWWLLCKTNMVVNPLIPPQAGTYIKILNQAYVSDILSSLKDS